MTIHGQQGLDCEPGCLMCWRCGSHVTVGSRLEVIEKAYAEFRRSLRSTLNHYGVRSNPGWSDNDIDRAFDQLLSKVDGLPGKYALLESSCTVLREALEHATECIKQIGRGEQAVFDVPKYEAALVSTVGVRMPALCIRTRGHKGDCLYGEAICAAPGEKTSPC